MKGHEAWLRVALPLRHGHKVSKIKVKEKSRYF